MNRIKKGDTVIVIAGKDKGRQGTVLEVGGDRLTIEGINIAKKHVKANPQRPDLQSGIIEQAMPLHRSNVMLFNPMTKKGDRVGFKVLEDGKKIRIFRSNNEAVDV
ncbi:MAG: 50S ribosomal protein L24 [Gammaproteobacteria bacterium]|nr:50S ribosomal protein L24 [Gammaproteobacteria bacterium]NND60031.1 50S ribosomal protein L24 [Gammaproteobacteria bacterium]